MGRPGGPYGTCLGSWVRAQLHLHALGHQASSWLCLLSSSQKGEGAWESRQAAARGQGVLCARGLLSFRCGHPGWLPSDWLGGWLYCPTVWRYARFTEVGAVFQVSSRQLPGSFVNTTPAQPCRFLGLVPGGDGSGNPLTIPFHLHFGSPACTHSQSCLSVYLSQTQSHSRMSG